MAPSLPHLTVFSRAAQKNEAALAGEDGKLSSLILDADDLPKRHRTPTGSSEISDPSRNDAAGWVLVKSFS